MSQPPDDLEARIGALEREVARLREQMALAGADAAAARVLAAGADRDVAEVRAELRAHTQTLNALRETQLEQGERIASMDGRLTSVEARLSSLEVRVASLESEARAGFAEMRSGFATMSTGMAEITALLRRIEEGR